MDDFLRNALCCVPNALDKKSNRTLFFFPRISIPGLCLIRRGGKRERRSEKRRRAWEYETSNYFRTKGDTKIESIMTIIFYKICSQLKRKKRTERTHAKENRMHPKWGREVRTLSCLRGGQNLSESSLFSFGE